ncbi:hypothetical protein FHS43_004769 [Streptosporangium becharense]|uniref:Basic proline-rich protein n=1 Tax=Streptosporangium becharense TaxID=1816182 RepID=A0A7W9MHP9_9ACTN|nr:hypothetical protein [Streptosporangium becharense]MBB2913465.1 hypothetical protein [Streptosporangium becharense]MBB5821155.1 hypothetical protein [Streptosporangium becharense]
MSLGLSGAVLLAVAPFAGLSQADSVARVAVAQLTEIPGCDVDPAGPCDTEEPTPVVTVTTTVPPEGGTETPAPQQTVTTTVIVPPKTKTPTTQAPPPQTPPPQETVAPPPPVVQPTQAPVIPTATPPVTPPPESDPQFPNSTPDQGIPSAETTPSLGPVSPEGASSATLEMRNAGSEFDGATLSRQLALPALILVLLVLFAVLIFEGRLRRLAHAAAVRRAGPRPTGYHADPMPPAGYPAAPAYGPSMPYQTGTAYAPIISLVPMQMYSPVYPESYPPEQFQYPYDQATAQYPYGQQTAQYAYEQQTTGFVPQPGQEQQPGAYGQAPHGPMGHPGQAPYGQAGQPGQVPYAPVDQPGQAPHGPMGQPGQVPYGPGEQAGHEVHPGQPGQGGPSAAFHDSGVSPSGPVPHEGGRPQEPWQGRPAEGPQPSGPDPQHGPGQHGPGQYGPQAGPEQGGSGQPGPEQGGPGVPPPPGPGVEFRPFGPEPGEGHPARGTTEFAGAPFPQEPGQGGPWAPGAPGPQPPGAPGPYPPGAPGAQPFGGPGPYPPGGPQPPGGPGLPEEPGQTATYPLPGQDIDKKKRGLFRRSK